MSEPATQQKGPGRTVKRLLANTRLNVSGHSGKSNMEA